MSIKRRECAEEGEEGGCTDEERSERFISTVEGGGRERDMRCTRVEREEDEFCLTGVCSNEMIERRREEETKIWCVYGFRRDGGDLRLIGLREDDFSERFDTQGGDEGTEEREIVGMLRREITLLLRVRGRRRGRRRRG